MFTGVKIMVFMGVVGKLGLGMLTMLIPKSLLKKKRMHFATACEKLDKRIARENIAKPDL